MGSMPRPLKDLDYEEIEQEDTEESEEDNQEESYQEEVKQKQKVVTTNSDYELVEVPVQTTIAYRKKGSDKVIDDKQVLLQILNDIQIIKKSLT